MANGLCAKQATGSASKIFGQSRVKEEVSHLEAHSVVMRAKPRSKGGHPWLAISPKLQTRSGQRNAIWFIQASKSRGKCQANRIVANLGLTHLLLVPVTSITLLAVLCLATIPRQQLLLGASLASHRSPLGFPTSPNSEEAQFGDLLRSPALGSGLGTREALEPATSGDLTLDEATMASGGDDEDAASTDSDDAYEGISLEPLGSTTDYPNVGPVPVVRPPPSRVQQPTSQPSTTQRPIGDPKPRQSASQTTTSSSSSSSGLQRPQRQLDSGQPGASLFNLNMGADQMLIKQSQRVSSLTSLASLLPVGEQQNNRAANNQQQQRRQSGPEEAMRPELATGSSVLRPIKLAQDAPALGPPVDELAALADQMPLASGPCYSGTALSLAIVTSSLLTLIICLGVHLLLKQLGRYQFDLVACDKDQRLSDEPVRPQQLAAGQPAKQLDPRCQFANPYYLEPRASGDETLDEAASSQHSSIQNHISRLHSRQVTSSVQELAAQAAAGHTVVDLTTGSGLREPPARPGDMLAVELTGHDFIGLGFEICGGQREGIFVKSVQCRGPARESGRLQLGDRIRGLSVDFEQVSLQDARDMLNSASPYKLRLLLEKADPSLNETIGPTSGVGWRTAMKTSVSRSTNGQQHRLASGENRQNQLTGCLRRLAGQLLPLRNDRSSDQLPAPDTSQFQDGPGPQLLGSRMARRRLSDEFGRRFSIMVAHSNLAFSSSELAAPSSGTRIETSESTAANVTRRKSLAELGVQQEQTRLQPTDHSQSQPEISAYNDDNAHGDGEEDDNDNDNDNDDDDEPVDTRLVIDTLARTAKPATSSQNYLVNQQANLWQSGSSRNKSRKKPIDVSTQEVDKINRTTIGQRDQEQAGQHNHINDKLD